MTSVKDEFNFYKKKKKKKQRHHNLRIPVRILGLRQKIDSMPFFFFFINLLFSIFKTYRILNELGQPFYSKTEEKKRKKFQRIDRMRFIAMLPLTAAFFVFFDFSRFVFQNAYRKLLKEYEKTVFFSVPLILFFSPFWGKGER